MVEITDLEPDGYSLIFLPSDFEKNINGHTWSLIIKAHCKLENINVDEILFDPESDMLCALSNKKEPLENLSKVINKLITSTSVYDKALENIDSVSDSSDEDMTTEEFLEYMEDTGLNMSEEHTFDFSLDSFKNEEQAIMVKKALECEGYNPKYEILDGEVFFNLVLQLIPKVSEVKKIESLLNRVSVMHSVEYIGFGVGDEE